jgi:hypothetical protein
LCVVPACLLAGTQVFAGDKVDVPTVVDIDGTRILKLPEDVSKYLAHEFPKYKIPAESEYDPDMLSFYYRTLIGAHPAVAWGDFNGDKKRDYAFLIETDQTKWGPLTELIVLNGGSKKGDYITNRLGEVYDTKMDYISFVNGKLTKGKYKKSAWYINWDKKTNAYVVYKS